MLSGEGVEVLLCMRNSRMWGRFFKRLCAKVFAIFGRPSVFRGSTLMETLTASVVFMIVFVISMDVLVRTGSSRLECGDYVVMENEINRYRRKLASESIRVGVYGQKYGWGELRADVAVFKEGIYRVRIEALFSGNGKKIRYEYLLTEYERNDEW